MKNAIAGAMLALAGLTTSGLAEDFPTRPLMMVVSYGAGGATDFQARIVTKNASAAAGLGMPIAILNKPGSGGRTGWNWFANHAPADGYTLAAYNLPHFIAQSIKGGVAYDTNSFEPIANWGADPAVFVVAADSPMTSMQDVVAYARAQPAQMSISGAGLFVGHHIATLQLEKAAGVTLDYQPSNGGGAAAMKAVIAGDVMGGVNNLSDAYRAQAAGLVKVLGLFDLTRHDYLPQVQTLREQGFDVDNASVNYRGVMVPKGTPDAIVAQLSAALPDMLRDPQVQGKMAAGGSPMHVMTREQVQAMWTRREETLKTLLEGL